jgi:hypothetical protein
MQTRTPEESNPSVLPVQLHTYPCAHSRSISARIRVIPTGTAQEFVLVNPVSQRSAAAVNPNVSAHVCSPKPSDARSNHLGRLDPHHLPALAWSPLSFLCAVTEARRRSRVVAMVTPPPFRPTAVAWTPVCASVRPCLEQPHAHVPVPSRATIRALAWRGQGQSFGSLSRQTLSALRPATGRGFAANGDPSFPGVQVPTRSRSCTLAQAHERANPVVALHTSSETKAPRSRPPHRSVSPHRRGRPSDRLGARASGQVSACVRPHARTQANTPVCHRGARRRGQATDMPMRSSEDMDAAFGRPVLTTAHASSPHTSEAKTRPSTCCGIRASLIEPRCPTLSAPGCSLSPPVFCSCTPAPAGVEPCFPCPNGARACSHACTPSQASCHATADTPAATLRSSSRTELFTITPPCLSGSFISPPHARACARPSCRLCSPFSSPVNTFARMSRT